MEDFPFPDSPGEAIVIVVIAAVLVGLYVLVRRTQQRHYREYWARRRFNDEHRLAEPDDPTQLPSDWERRDDPPG